MDRCDWGHAYKGRAPSRLVLYETLLVLRHHAHKRVGHVRPLEVREVELPHAPHYVVREVVLAGHRGGIYVDKHDDGTGDLHRARKDSFFYYQKLIASNGEDLD